MTVHLQIMPPAEPRTRGDCVDGPRPCTWAGCRHHILSSSESCSLDVAAQGSLGLREVGAILGLSSERWPANIILSHLPGCEPIGTAQIKAAPAWNDNRPPSSFTGAKTSEVHHANDDGTETVERWACVEGCAVAELDAQTNTLVGGGSVRSTRAATSVAMAGGPVRWRPIEPVGDSGGASRFFYQAKASREERDRGCEHLPLRSAAEVTDSAEGAARLDSPRTGAGRTSGARNHHPCVKPVDLCRYLARLLLPPAGRSHGARRILVPYAGSGSEMMGALLAGWDEVVGIERDADFIEILKARVGLAATNPRAFEPDAPRKTEKVDARQTSLFGGSK